MAADYDQYKGILTILGRPTRSLRLKGQYSYTTANRSDYGTIPLERHEGQLFATYSLSRSWGMTANYATVAENNNELKMSTLDLVNSTVPPFVPLDFDTYRLPRHSHRNNVTVSLWFSPMERLTLSGSYGFMRGVTDQSIIFSGPVKNSNAPSRYTSQSQLASLNAAYHYDDSLNLSLALQRIRSYSRFTPDFITPRAGLDTAGISGISRVDTIENSLSSRADYQFTKNFLCSVNYSYRDYNDKVLANFSGTVHVISASFGGSW
jgi:hypothetical protein